MPPGASPGGLREPDRAGGGRADESHQSELLRSAAGAQARHLPLFCNPVLQDECRALAHAALALLADKLAQAGRLPVLPGGSFAALPAPRGRVDQHPGTRHVNQP